MIFFLSPTLLNHCSLFGAVSRIFPASILERMEKMFFSCCQWYDTMCHVFHFLEGWTFIKETLLQKKLRVTGQKLICRICAIFHNIYSFIWNAANQIHSLTDPFSVVYYIFCFPSHWIHFHLIFQCTAPVIEQLLHRELLKNHQKKLPIDCCFSSYLLCVQKRLFTFSQPSLFNFPWKSKYRLA